MLPAWRLIRRAICLWRTTTTASSMNTSRTGSRATFASGLYHPAGMAFDSSGNLFVADNSIGNLYQGNIYKYKPDGHA